MLEDLNVTMNQILVIPTDKGEVMKPIILTQKSETATDILKEQKIIVFKNVPRIF